MVYMTTTDMVDAKTISKKAKARGALDAKLSNRLAAILSSPTSRAHGDVALGGFAFSLSLISLRILRRVEKEADPAKKRKAVEVSALLRSYARTATEFMNMD